MKASSNKRAVIVGIFVFLGIAILVAAVLTLGGQQKTFEKKVTVRAIFDDVGGLQTGNNVWFSGVKIGRVSSMGFYGTSQVEVIMSIEEEAKQYIRKNAKAKISSEGFIGNKIVVIYGGTTQQPPIEQGGTLAVESTLSTDEIMATFQQNNRTLLDVTSNFKTISQRIVNGEGTLGKLMTDETLLNELQSTAATLRRASDNAQRLTSDISNYTSRLQTKGSLSYNLVRDTVVFNRLRSTAMQLQQVSATATEVTNNLKSASENFNNTNSPIGALLNDEEAATNLKATLRNLQTGTEKLDENMEALQHNFLFRGFFRKKAKNEAKEKADESQSSQTKTIESEINTQGQ